MDREKLKQTVQEEVKTAESPFELSSMVDKYLYVYSFREDGLFECRLKGGRIEHTIQSKEVWKLLEERIERIAEYIHAGYEHTIGILTFKGIELLETLDKNHDLFHFLSEGWKGIFKKYIGGKMEFLELLGNRKLHPRMGTMFSLEDMEKKLSQYIKKYECTQKEACFALMFLNKEFRRDYGRVSKDQRYCYQKYKLYKKFTDRLDKLEEMYKEGKLLNDD